MPQIKPSKEALACNDRVLEIFKSLFGDTLGNEYRREFASLHARGQGAIAVAETRQSLLVAIFQDPSTADASLAQLAKKPAQAMTIYLALNLAQLSLMNPASAESQEAWVREMTRVGDKTGALVMACLETLEESLNGGKLVGIKATMPSIE